MIGLGVVARTPGDVEVVDGTSCWADGFELLTGGFDAILKTVSMVRLKSVSPAAPDTC